MENNTEYLKAICRFYQCDIELAKKLLQSAKINKSKSELDRIVKETEKELLKNAD